MTRLGGSSRADSAGDADIRSALRGYLRRRCAAHTDTRIIEELGLCGGQARIDLAVVNGAIHAYEIKSDRDRLHRLPLQVEIYSKVVDRATIVLGPRHLDAALRILPEWWGVIQVTARDEKLSIELNRPAKKNPERAARALAELLWRDEALALLETRRAANGVRSKPRCVIWDRVCEAFDVNEIGAAVRDRLKSRPEQSALA